MENIILTQGVAAWDAAWDAAGAAAEAALESTVEILQASAIDLLERMAALTHDHETTETT